MTHSVWSRIEGGITAPRGFKASGIAAGLKSSTTSDLALVQAPQGAVCAGTFTQSIVRAACVDLCIERLKISGNSPSVVLINSGHANACTGKRGLRDSLQATEEVAKRLGIKAAEVLICSTGVIGTPIPMDNLLKALDSLVEALTQDGGHNAARAILTTDLVEKEIALEGNCDGRRICIGGMAKGSGMIHPNMATMLGFISCDAGIPRIAWEEMINRIVNDSFNSITVDGDTSTNDAFLAFSGGEVLPEKFWPFLEEGLRMASQSLAKAIARDGEGAKCLLEVQVLGAKNTQEAKHIARIIAGSALVKTAINGCDPNWGRIIAAAGRAGVPFKLNNISLWIGSFQLMKAGQPINFPRNLVSEYIRDKTKGAYLVDDCVTIKLSLGSGSGSSFAWGCDLSDEYVRINADYTT